MSVNFSSSSNSSVLHCYDSTVSLLLTTAFSITRTFLLIPLSIFVLYLGHQRWRQQRSFTTTSHCDTFTYHMAAMELIWCFGVTLFHCGSSNDLPEMIIVGHRLTSVTYHGEALFHVLTCVERYLAVVHPITYLHSRKRQGIRIRNIAIGCVWLLCIGGSSVTSLHNPILSRKLLFLPLVFSLVVSSWCSLSVLRVLIRPGPGEGGQDRQWVDQSKQRAFHTITAIMAVMWLWFLGFLVYVAVDVFPLFSHNVSCVVKTSTYWSSLPSSLVLPLLYVHRAGQLSCCYENTGSRKTVH